jgi:Na+/melibiose symporter-like transporter
MLYFIYSPPKVNSIQEELIVFAWFTVFICLFSSFFTIFSVNYSSLFPKKFRSDKHRRDASALIGAISFVASGFGSIFPALIIQYNNRASFSLMAFLSMVIAFIAMLFTIPGIFEKKEERQFYLNLAVKQNNVSFFKNITFSLKQSNFLVLIIVNFFVLIIMRSVGAAFPYAVRYIFHSPAITIALVSACYIGGAVISMPIWNKIGNKINNNKKLFLITGVALISSQIMLLFVDSLYIAYFAALIYGFCVAGYWTLLTMPINADVLDELAHLTGERNDAIYMGIRGFFINFSIVAQSALFALIHESTGFIENAENQTLLAQWGIRFTLALIPMICTLISILIFSKFYHLPHERLKT